MLIVIGKIRTSTPNLSKSLVTSLSKNEISKYSISKVKCSFHKFTLLKRTLPVTTTIPSRLLEST